MLSFDRPLVMGILNVTPDSFSDGGRYDSLEQAVTRAAAMVQEGADIIDIGGESTRPGAKPVSEQEELDRVIPVIEVLSAELSVTLSVDTVKPGVMEEAVNAGAQLVNDVNALREEGAVELVARLGVPVCLMHMKGAPETMQNDPRYSEVVREVELFLSDRVKVCEQAGIDRSNILVDPGFGFGKTVKQNYQLFAALHRIRSLGYPLLVGVSRKSMIGAIIDAPPEQRVLGSSVLAALAVERGANILRVHDVKETCQALALLEQIKINAV